MKTISLLGPLLSLTFYSLGEYLFVFIFSNINSDSKISLQKVEEYLRAQRY